jgi:alpha-amylase/alpha-mannosidase (GH57 family)
VTTDVLFLWHMHQPLYLHPVSGRPLLPWVRLHACAGYLDMARALERRPGVRVTVNFVPSLVEQIELMLAGTRDALEEAAAKPTAELDEAERRLVLARCFSVRRDRMVATRPRYAELLAKRGENGAAGALAEKARAFTTSELTDVQCLFLLAWLGFAAREDYPEIAGLEAKGRGFGEDDKRTLLELVRGAAGKVLPTWRRLAERGQVELSSTPYYHPIVPLLIDSDAARRARPGDALPPRFAHPDDAAAHIRLALEAHERSFGARPRGMWPSEGSLSPEAVALYGELGVSWLAGDEETLYRSLGGTPPRARARAWRHAGVQLVFRDRELSDRIGFRYADVPAQAAANDLLGAARASGGDGGMVGLFLDGENAWEAYPRRGADFLDAVYARLEEETSAGRLRARTISEALAERPGETLPRLHSGSWIEGSFKIWIGDPVKNRAWERLGRARERVAQLERTRAPGDRGVEAAKRQLLAAEGSDWFWWYGEPFSSAEDPIFDELFRAHLEAAWRALGEDAPADLAEPLDADAPRPRPQAATALIHPIIDGRADRFFEWQGAALFEVGRGAAMADSGHAIERVHIGFGDGELYLRVDPVKAHRRRVAAARLVLRLRVGDKDRTVRVAGDVPGGGPEVAELGGHAAAEQVWELALPLAALGAAPRDELRLWLTLEQDGVTFARVPRDGVMAVVTPWPGWEDENWTA